jgi:hypothetical protein
MSTLDPRAPLLPHLSQYQLDFVIPRIGIDLPLGIDPFLLFKSRDSEYRRLHTLLIATFNAGIAAIREGNTDEAHRLFDFPEVSAIGLGYTQGGKRGSGVGSYLAGLIIDTLEASPALQQRGVRHVEEMQLLSAGIGPDRVSDITANVLKRFLIEYTQRQCRIWNVETAKHVPVSHIFNHLSKEWEDAFEDLPISPINGAPILFVPRRIVRVLPWINYDDFVRSEFNAYLKARRDQIKKSSTQAKTDVVTVTRRDISLVDRYVKAREAQGGDARPTLDYIDEDLCRESERLKEQLAAIAIGRSEAERYQHLVLEIMNFLFSPELIDGQPEIRTIDGTERRDIIFTNDSDESFWEYVRNEYGIILMFETKNTEELDTDAINQTATYLGVRIGGLGVIVTRRPPKDSIIKKIMTVFNDGRKVILTLCDDQLRELLDLRCQGGSPTRWMQKHYRNFRVSLQ